VRRPTPSHTTNGIHTGICRPKAPRGARSQPALRTRYDRRVAALAALAVDRQALVVAAFGALMFAGVVVAVGALVLFRREGRHRRRGT
jgi:hypothetical protein